MRNLSYVLAAILACVPLEAGACEASWADSPIDPVAIVVGHLADVSPASFEQPREFTHPGTGEVNRSVDLFSCGSVVVDSVLWGENPSPVFPVCWVSGSRPVPEIEGHWTWHSGVKHLQEGDRRIWVIRRVVKAPGDSDVRYNEFQALDLEIMDRTRQNIAERWPD